MAHFPIECPSGLRLTSRKYKGREANLFTHKKLVRSGGLISAILDSICVEVLDPGPYKLGADGKPPWDSMLSGDRLTALVDSRVGTYTREISFGCQCTNPMCRERWTEDVDLTRDIKRKPLSEESRVQFENGTPFTTFVFDEDGHKHGVTYNLMTGQHEAQLTKVTKRHKDQQATASLSVRVVEIQGVHKNDMLKFLGNVDLDELNALIERMDEADCGLDTSIEVECPECGNWQEIEVPLGGEEFFLPKRKGARRSTMTES